MAWVTVIDNGHKFRYSEPVKKQRNRNEVVMDRLKAILSLFFKVNSMPSTWGSNL